MNNTHNLLSPSNEAVDLHEIEWKCALMIQLQMLELSSTVDVVCIKCIGAAARQQKVNAAGGCFICALNYLTGGKSRNKKMLRQSLKLACAEKARAATRGEAARRLAAAAAVHGPDRPQCLITAVAACNGHTRDYPLNEHRLASSLMRCC